MRAKTEAAKACLSYAEGEISLKLEKAKLKASMEMLNYEKEAAVAIVEAEVLKAAVGQESQKHVIGQAKEQERELQLCDDGVPTQTKPSPTYSGSPSHLKPEARPFFPHLTNTISQPSHLATQQP